MLQRRGVVFPVDRPGVDGGDGPGVPVLHAGRVPLSETRSRSRAGDRDAVTPLRRLCYGVDHALEVQRVGKGGVGLGILGDGHCLLGDNGAGKSTFIKTTSGVHKPSAGEIFFEGKPMHFESPRDAMEAGIATVFQDLAMIPLMSVARSFFMGREPTKGSGPLMRLDITKANSVTMQQMRDMGIDLREPDQAVGTLSGGERQTVAIARAVYFGTKLLILDEPTSALGVRQTPNVLATIA